VKSDAFRLEQGTQRRDFKLTRDPSGDRTVSRPFADIRVTRGLVQDPNDRPAGKATVVFFPTWGTNATTDTQGRFKVLYSPLVPPGSRGTCYLVARDHLRNLAGVLRFDEVSTGDLLVRLAPGLVVTGRVVDPEGKGIPGARLMPMFFMETGHGQGLIDARTSDPNGCFEIRGLPPGHRHDIRATAEGYGDGRVEVHPGAAVNNRLDLKPLVLVPTNLTIRGVVVTPEGEPIPGASVYCLGGTGDYRTARTDTAGRFVLEKICAGPTTISARAGGRDGPRANVPAKGGDKDVRIVLTGRGLKSETAP